MARLLLLLALTLPAWASPFVDFFRGPELPAFHRLPPRSYGDLKLPAAVWEEPHTRTRLRQLFEHYLYGYAPAEPSFKPRVVTRETLTLPDGTPVDYWDVDLTPELPGPPAQTWRLGLFLPVGTARHPMILALNKCGNHTVVHHPRVFPRQLNFQLEACATPEFAPGERQHFWNVGTTVSRGWGFATLHESDVAPDDPARMRARAMAHYPEARFAGRHGWGALAAWAWGLRAVAAHLSLHERVDPSRIVTLGHSRRGKAALLAAAFAERTIAGVVPHQSGFLGLAPARPTDTTFEQGIWRKTLAFFMALGRENVYLMERSFPHWLTPSARKFAWDEDKLPVEQYLLAAMVAPRPLLASDGVTDYWANYAGALATLRTAQSMLPGLPPGRFGQLRLDTGHTMTRAYWPLILDFLERELPR